MTRTITLINDFHNTDVTLRPRGGWLSKDQVRRARRMLCGVTGCTCGGNAGERGKNPQLEPHPDGSCKVIS